MRRSAISSCLEIARGDRDLVIGFCGSVGSTSMPAPPMTPSRIAAISAWTSSSWPRAVLISIAVDFIRRKDFRADHLTRFRCQRAKKADDIGDVEERFERSHALYAERISVAAET